MTIKTKEFIEFEIAKLKGEDRFFFNLVYVGIYYDRFGESNKCAFLNTNAEETIIGFAGTNQDNG